MPQTDFPLCPPMSAPVYHAAFPPTRCLPSARRPSVMYPLSEALRPGVEESACSTLPKASIDFPPGMEGCKALSYSERRDINLLSQPSRGSCSGGGSHTFILAPNARAAPQASGARSPAGLPEGPHGVPAAPHAAPHSSWSSHWSLSKGGNIQAEVHFLVESKHVRLFLGMPGRREVLECDLEFALLRLRIESPCQGKAKRSSEALRGTGRGGAGPKPTCP